MKKSLILVLSLPLLLASCEIKMGHPKTDQNPGEQTSQTGDQSGQGTEGSTSEDEGHSGGFHPGGGTHSGGSGGTGGGTGTGGGSGSGTGTGTGGGTTEGGGTTGGGTTGGGTTGGGTTEGGTTEGGGTSTTTNESVSKSASEFGLENASKPSTFNFNEDITLTCELGSNNRNNRPAYYSNDATLRFYFGNKFTITNSKGVISRIVLYYTPSEDDNIFSANVGTMSDHQTWVGSAASVTFTLEGNSGQARLASLKVEYSTSGGSSTTGEGSSTGGGTTGGGGSGGQTTGDDIQAGNGNTSHAFTSPWEGIQKDIVYQMFKGNLPHLTDFNKYKVGEWTGSTLPYFNPYIESNWSKNAQDDYELALKEMGYKLISSNPYVDEDGNEYKDTIVKEYQKGTFFARTQHYQGTKNVWYFEVYAWNEYSEADPNFTVKSEIDRSKITLKSGYQSFDYTGGGYKYSCPAATKYSDFGIQVQANSKITITGDLHDMNILFYKNAFSCVVYAGSSTSNLQPVYNDACNFKFPSGTKVVEIRTLDKELIVENICVD